MPKPTPEHVAEAERIWRVWSGSTSADGPTMPELIAQSLAVFGRKDGDEVGQIVEDVRASYAAKYGTPADAPWDDLFAAAEARGGGKRATYVLQADLDDMEARHARVAAGMLAEIKAATTERNELRALQAEQQRAFADGLRVATKAAREDGARAMRDHVADRILARSDALAKIDAIVSAGDLALAIEIGAIDYTTVAAESAS